MKANLTKKINIIENYIEGWKNHKLIELALTQLNRAWDQLIENHKEFETLCSNDEELQNADTWLLESQAVVEELICRAVNYQEDKIDSGGSELNAPIVAGKFKQADQSDIASVTSIGHKSSKESGSKLSRTTSSSSSKRAKAAAREADLAKLKVEQLKEKARLEAKIAAQKAQLEAQLTIKEAEQEVDRKEKEALLLKEEIDEDNIVERLKDIEDDASVAERSGKIKIVKPMTQTKKEDPSKKDTKFTTQKVKEWLADVSPKEEPDELSNPPKQTENKEIVVDLTKLSIPRSALVSSLPKLNLPVFNGDPCDWPNWYGMFKALVHDQRLSKTQKMIYLKASVKGTAEKAIAGMFFDVTMYDEAIKELTCQFGNPGLISKSLISKLLEMSALKDESTSSLRSFVDTLHNLVRTLKTYGHREDLKAAANMQHVMGKLPPAISERWSRKKLELQAKEVDLTDLDKRLETEVQVKEMAFGCSKTEDSKQDGGKSKPYPNRSKWSKKQKDPPNNTFPASGAKTECIICKGDHGITLCETWKKAAVNDCWELAKKFGLCFRCLKRNHQIGRCSLKGTCPVEGCE